RNETFKSKLASYSAVASSLLVIGKFADAQIVYTDIIPDDTLIIPYDVEQYTSSYYLDLNNDGLVDFKFSYSYSTWTGPYNSNKFWSILGYQYNGNQMLGNDYFDQVYEISYGVPIKAAKPWINPQWVYTVRLASRHWF